MNENIVEKNNNGEDADSGKKSASEQGVYRHGAAVTLAVSIVLLVIIAGGLVFLNNKINNSIGKLESIAAASAGNEQLVEKKILALENKLSGLSAQYQELQNSITDLDLQQPDSNADWALSEIEYLLTIAMHRLQLEQDVNTALTAMEAALLRLEALDDPDLLPVREQFVSDINNLKAVNPVDITGLSVYLADLVERANKLPLNKTASGVRESKTRMVIQENNDSGWKGLLNSVWQEIKSLVVIKKTGEIKQELLLPAQEYFLYQNLRLELESARTSALMRDTENFHTSISLIQNWLNQYFDISDGAVINVLDTLDKMSRVNLKPGLPDVNSSLETLRAYVRNRETAQSSSLSHEMALLI